ncbi:MAG: hypothetical protein M0Q92_02630 [Methanoregula sp.]|jgi:hypothetical protein|nr:hypothetical protein [Methanoregula sp.]
MTEEIRDCPTCRYDVPMEERQRIGPSAPLCRHPEEGEPGFWDRRIEQCWTPREGAE